MAGPNPVQILPQNTPFTIPKEGKLILIVTSTISANLTFKASDKGRKLGYPDQFSITQPLNAVLPVEGGFFEFVTLTNNATVTITFGMDIVKDYLPQLSPISPNTPYLNNYNVTQDTLLRDLERIVPRNGLLANYSNVLLVAAGAASSAGPYYLAAGTFVLLQFGISQDALGTTPHASYIKIVDPTNTPLEQVIGALLPYVSTSFYIGVSGNYKIVWYNGDSVSHTFYMNFYAVAT